MKKIVVTQYQNKTISLCYKDRKPDYFHCQDQFSGEIGNIYIAKVKNVVASVKACFAEYQKDRLCFVAFNTIKPANILHNTNNRELPVQGDEILIQITTEALKTKVPNGSGVIRVNGRKIKLDSSNEIYNTALSRTPFSLIKESVPEYISFINNHINEYPEIITDSDEIYVQIMEELKLTETTHKISSDTSRISVRQEQILAHNENNTISLQHYTDEFGLNVLFSINSFMESILSKKVWLNCGGYLVIEPTEAFVSIDVNSGKAIDKKDYEQSVLRINLDAAIEAARQIRLRNLSGMILIDFINMKSEENNQKLISTLVNELEKDEIATNFVDLTPLGIAEITRKKISRPLHQIF